MRIIHIVPALTKGGGEKVAVDLANHAAAQGHEVHVVAVARADETLLRNELSAAISVSYVVSAGRLRRYAALVPWVLRNWKWLREADIVHCHMTISAVIGAMIFQLRRATGGTRPIVVETYHAVGMQIPQSHQRLHARLAERRDALALMATDPFWAAFRESHPDLLTAIIPNGVKPAAARASEPEERLAVRRELGIPDSARLVVGTIGRLEHARKPWLYPEIFAAIARRVGADVHFVIGGAGQELGRVEEAIARTGIENQIHLPGLLREPGRALSVMDLYLTLNVGAITGVAALEAAFAGVPILAIQLLDDHRPGPADWIWSSGDLGAISERAVALLEDPTARAALAERQREHAMAHHSVEGMARAYDGLYQAALARNGAAPARL